MTSQEQENFYRHSTVIVDETKDSFLHLLDFHLTNQGITLQRFIEINGHDIYHLCFNRYPCCQCPPGTHTGTRGSRVLHPPQMEILFDKTGNKLPGHNLRSISAPHCCCPVNPNLQLQDLDCTLARLLLVNFTTLVPEGSPEKIALDDLVNSRNHSFAHAKEGKMSNSEYHKSMAEIEKSLLILAKVYGKESETEQRLIDINKQPLNSAVCLQLQSTLLQQQICELDEKINQLLVLGEEKLPDCLTRDLCDVTVTEGCDARFEFWTRECGVCSLWFQDGVEIVRSEKFIARMSGRIHSLDIRNTLLSDKGLYSVRIHDIERPAHLDVEEYFTKNLQSVECIEGETAEFTCEVKEDSLTACWNKNGIHLENEGKYEILQAGKLHRLSIKNCGQHDTAKYTVSINNRVRETSLSVIEYFSKPLGTMKCKEGETVQFECEVLDDNEIAQWFKDGTEVSTSDRYKVERHGRLHRLVIINTGLDDQGDYSVKVKHCVRHSQLIVQEYFTKPLKARICTECQRVQLECEVLQDDQTALWFKDGTEVNTSYKYKMERDGRLHRLVVSNIEFDDEGEYLVKIKNCVRRAQFIYGGSMQDCICRNCTVLCQKHTKKNVLFCCQHNALICSLCLPESHQQCSSLMQLENAANKVRTSAALEDLQNKFKCISQTLEQMIQEQSITFSKVDKQRLNILQDISQTRQKINKYLDKLEFLLKTELDKVHRLCQQRITGTKPLIQNMYDTLKKDIENFELKKNLASNIDLFQTVKYYESKTSEHEKEIRNLLEQQKFSILEFIPSENFHALESILISFGRIEMRDYRSSVPITTLGSHQGQVILLPACKNKICRISKFSLTKFGENVSIRSGCIMPNGNLLLSDCTNKCVYTCTVNGSEMKKIKFPCFPTAITVYNPNVALVATSSGIHTINLASFTVDKLVKAGACWAISSAEDTIWTGIKNVLCKIAINGKVQKKITLPFDLDDICVSTTGEIYLLESSGMAVYQVSTDGVYKKLFENTAPRQSYIGLSLGYDKDLFISEPMDNSIHYITHNFQHSEVILSAADGIRRPVGLAFNHELNQLSVINENGTSIYTYILQ